MSKFKYLTYADSSSFLLVSHIEELSKIDAINIEHRDLEKRGIGTQLSYFIAEMKLETQDRPVKEKKTKTDTKKDGVTLFFKSLEKESILLKST